MPALTIANREFRMVFAYFFPKQKVGTPRRTAGGGELSPAKNTQHIVFLHYG